jgi:hypothetical protein
MEIKMFGFWKSKDKKENKKPETPVIVKTEFTKPVPSKPVERIPLDRPDLGFISGKYESRGGVGTISTGKNDPGGKSYGIYQIASKTGTLASYVCQSDFKDNFKGVELASPDFDRIWKKLSTEKPVEFSKDQKRFIVRTHYKPAANVADGLGFDMTQDAVQEAIYSMSVQHGKYRTIITNAARSNPRAIKDQVEALYDARESYVRSLKGLPIVTKDAILNRFKSERKDVLKLVK